MKEDSFQYTKATYSLHNGSIANTSPNVKFNSQQNLLIMNLYGKSTSSFTNKITDVLIKNLWLDHTLCKSTVNMKIEVGNWIKCTVSFVSELIRLY